MSADQAKLIARRRWNLTNERHLAGFDEILADDFVHHGPGYDFRGRRAYADHLTDFFRGFPDARVVIEEVSGNDQWVATVCTLTGRQTQPVPWEPNPTGEPKVARLVTIHAVVDGKIAAEWIVQEWRAADGASAPSPDGGRQAVRSRNGGPALLEQRTKTVIERYRDLWNTGNPVIVDEVCLDDMVVRHTDGSETRGRAAFKAGVGHHHDTLADFRVAIDEVVADGDRAAIRFRATAAHVGPFLGSVPTGRPLAWTGMQLLRLADDKIAEVWHQPDNLALHRQLGLVPEAASVGSR